MILHQHFKTPYSGGAIRSYYLAKALVDHGIETTVITARTSETYEVENVDGIEVHYLPIAYDNAFKFYKRSLAFLHFAWQAVKVSDQFKNADICYAISVPLTVGIAARKIRARHKIPFIFEVGDLWPDAPVQLGFIRNTLLRKYLYRLEEQIYKSAQAVVALSTAIKSAVENKVPGKEVHLLPNISDTDFFKPEKKNPELERKFGVQNKFVVSYIGAVGFANGLGYFLECARVSQQASLPVHFLLCGEGAELEHLKQLHCDYKLGNFTFTPFQTRDGVREIMNVTDATFISYRPEPILQTGSPNKYFDGLAAGKLIVVNFGGWIKDEVERTRCGIYIDPQVAEDFVVQLKPFLKSNDLLTGYQRSARHLAEQSYSRHLLSEKFVNIFRAAKDGEDLIN